MLRNLDYKNILDLMECGTYTLEECKQALATMGSMDYMEESQLLFD